MVKDTKIWGTLYNVTHEVRTLDTDERIPKDEKMLEVK